MKKILIFCFFLLPLWNIQAKERTVDRPAFLVRNTSTIEIRKITVNDTATIMYIDVFSRPKGWIRISPDSYLSADGKKYPVKGAEGIRLGEKFYMPDSGEHSFILTFPPLPALAKSIDFIESDCSNCYKIWGIRLDGKKTAGNPAIRGLSKKTNVEDDIPAAEMKKGNAILKGKLLDYQPGMDYTVTVYYKKLLSDKTLGISTKVSSRGEFTAEIPLYTAQQISIWLPPYNCSMIVAPGRESEIIFNLHELSRSSSRYMKDTKPTGSKFYFAGAFASLNTGLQDERLTLSVFPAMGMNRANIVEHIVGMTPEQYKNYSLSSLEKIIEKNNVVKGVDGKCIALANLFCKLTAIQNINNYDLPLRLAYCQANNVTISESYDTFLTPVMEPDFYLYMDSLGINDPLALCYQGYTDLINSLKYEYRDIEQETDFMTRSGRLTEDEQQLYRAYMESIKQGKIFHGDTKRLRSVISKYRSIYEEYQKLNPLEKRLADAFGKGIASDLAKAQSIVSLLNDFLPLTDSQLKGLDSFSNPFYKEELIAMNLETLHKIELNKQKTDYRKHEIPQAEKEQLLQAILDPFKGNVVLVDFWATWCGPCKDAIEGMKSIKSALSGKNIVYVYLADESSPLKTWENMIPDIPGEHFRMPSSQWASLRKQYQASGVPTFIIIDKEGNITWKQVGFSRAEIIKTQLEKVLSK